MALGFPSCGVPVSSFHTAEKQPFMGYC